MLIKRLALIMALLFIGSSSVFSEEDLPVFETKTKVVGLFKNGLGFFIREGEVRPKDGWAVIDDVPVPALGTLWIGSPDEKVRITEAIGIKEEIEESVEAISIPELLRANLGKKVKLQVGGDLIEGKIISVPEDRKAWEDSASLILRPPSRNYYSRANLSGPVSLSSTIVVLETDDGLMALGKGSIQRIIFPDGYVEETTIKREVRRIKVKIEGRRKRVPITISYLQKGVTWLPSYEVDISDQNKAKITMKAVVVNDIEDLEDVDLYFIVGYPNLQFAEAISPMAMRETLAQFIENMNRAARGERYTPGIMRQAIAMNAAAFEPAVATYRAPAAEGMGGAPEEDLFLYHRKWASIKRGERAYYPIFSDDVEYEHIYEWTISDTIEENPRERREREKAEEEYVWHSIKLFNSTAYPWTTAPATTVHGWKLLGQDTLNYTAKGQRNNLKVTVATDVKAENREFEVERERGINLYGSRYDLVTVRGELYIKNCKGKAIGVEIKKHLTGEVKEVSHEGKVEKLAEGLKRVNYNSMITWELPFNSGEEKTITYTYRIYIRT